MNAARLILLAVIVALSGCALVAPPLPPSTPRPEVSETMGGREAAHQAVIECARSYGMAHAAATTTSASEIAEAAPVACSKELLEYRTALVAYAQGSRRGFLGFGHPAITKARNAADAAAQEVRDIALEAVVAARSSLASPAN